jgi:hypothetical protein
MGKRQATILAFVILGLLGGAVGCGAGTSTSTDVAETVGEEREYPWVTGAAREFLVPGGDNLIQTFGEEASLAERKEASKVVRAWMDARVAEDWVTDCRLLSRKYKKTLVWGDAYLVSEGKVKTCPQALAYFGDEASGTSGRTLKGLIDSLRIKGTEDTESEWEAWAQWHGPKGIDWVLPLEQEAGTWKVAVAAPIYRTR